MSCVKTAMCNEKVITLLATIL